MAKIYNCDRANGGNGGGCELAGDSVWGHGPTAVGFCQLSEKWLDDFTGCPKADDESEE